MLNKVTWMVILLSSQTSTRAFRAVVSSCRFNQQIHPTKTRSCRVQTLYPSLLLTTTAKNGLASTQSMVYPTEMTEDERYLFDLNGFLIVRNVLSHEEVVMANAAIDAREDLMIERNDKSLRNAVPGSKMYGTGPGRKDMGRVLEWGNPDSTVFKSILAHPRLVPLFHGILGKGYHMDHLPFILAQDHGAEGFQLHGGTVDCISGEYNPHLAYSYQHGMIRTALLGCNVMLTDHNAGDGGFCVVPGSHKSNFVRTLIHSQFV